MFMVAKQRRKEVVQNKSTHKRGKVIRNKIKTNQKLHGKPKVKLKCSKSDKCCQVAPKVAEHCKVENDKKLIPENVDYRDRSTFSAYIYYGRALTNKNNNNNNSISNKNWLLLLKLALCAF